MTRTFDRFRPFLAGLALVASMLWFVHWMFPGLS